ncbi:MAG: exodeoxyribonuclease VII small subunit [Pseudomonadota bacterium]
MNPTSKKKSTATVVDFEQSFTQLESIVASLENSELPLDEALKIFEQGIKLTGHCQKALNKAEQKVQVLMKNSNMQQ